MGKYNKIEAKIALLKDQLNEEIYSICSSKDSFRYSVLFKGEESWKVLTQTKKEKPSGWSFNSANFNIEELENLEKESLEIYENLDEALISLCENNILDHLLDCDGIHSYYQKKYKLELK